MSVQEKVAQKRAEMQARTEKGTFKKKHDPFLLWGEYPHGWTIIKDGILCMMLMSALIGQLKQIDLSSLMATRTIVIVNEAHTEVVKATMPIEEPKTQQEAKSGQFTAYSKGDGFTPGSIMANGKEVHEGAVACPTKYKFGTKIKVNGKIYECSDRMAERFRDGEFFDLYMSDIDEALNFGRKTLTYQVL